MAQKLLNYSGAFWFSQHKNRNFFFFESILEINPVCSRPCLAINCGAWYEYDRLVKFRAIRKVEWARLAEFGFEFEVFAHLLQYIVDLKMRIIALELWTAPEIVGLQAMSAEIDVPIRCFLHLRAQVDFLDRTCQSRYHFVEA